MYDYHYLMLEDRSLREREFSERRAMVNRGRRVKSKPPLRSRLARRLFSLAFAADEREAWRAVWERMTGVKEVHSWRR